MERCYTRSWNNFRVLQSNNTSQKNFFQNIFFEAEKILLSVILDILKLISKLNK